MARTDLTKSLLSRFEKLEGQRQNWETHWQEVADYMQPRKADVTKQRARGDKRMEQVFDSSQVLVVFSLLPFVFKGNEDPARSAGENFWPCKPAVQNTFRNSIVGNLYQ